MELRVTTAPSKLPVEVLDARQHLQIEHTDDDGYIKTLIKAATNVAQIITGRKFITQTITIELDATETASPIRLPYPPFQSVTTFKYYDGDRTKQTVDSATYSTIGTNPARIVADDGGWSVYQSYQALEIVYVVGYGLTSASIPEDIVHAIKIIVADLWNNPESSKLETRTQLTANQVPYAALALLQPYRVLT